MALLLPAVALGDWRAPDPWWQIDFWAMGIEEEPCETRGGPFSSVCELVIEEEVVDELALDIVQRDAPTNSYFYRFKDNVLTIYSQEHDRNSFVCCDVQGPFRPQTSSDGYRFSATSFGLPDGVFLELALMNDVILHGEPLIYNALSPEQELYLESRSTEEELQVEVINIAEFDRSVILHRNSPDTPPSWMVCFKDGKDVSGIFGHALRLWFERSGDDFPSIAFVGIESGESEVRHNEYLKTLTNDSNAYASYRDVFSDHIVPHLEEMVGFSGGNENRVLIGKSNGGKWVLDYALDHPDFACHVIALSPSGRRKDLGFSSFEEQGEHCLHVYLSAGILEPSFAEGVRDVEALLTDHGIPTTVVIENAGHSSATWVPALLKGMQGTLKRRVSSE